MFCKLKSNFHLKSIVFIICTIILANIQFCTANSPESLNQNEDIPVNCCFSIGQTCRTAYHIQKHGKRFQAAPLDWMRDFSLDTCLHLFKTKFEDFFEEIKEISSNDQNRNIIDTKNNILSIHHFSSKNPLHEEQIRFRSIMQNRAKKLDEIFKRSQSIALVYHQEETLSPQDNDKLLNFLQEFSKIYPNKNIYLIHVLDDNIQNIKSEVVFNQNNLKIIRFTFLDIHEEKHFSGNHMYWDKVMNCIKLVPFN